MSLVQVSVTHHEISLSNFLCTDSQCVQCIRKQCRFYAVLEVGAFERLLGPCMEVMKRNFQHYEEQLMELFGTTMDITDTR